MRLHILPWKKLAAGGAVVAALAAILGVGAVLWSGNAATTSQLIPRSPAADPAVRGAEAFYGDSFGGLAAGPLNTHALPWRLSAAALVVAARQGDPSLPLSQATLNRQLAGFGFLIPKSIGNWPGAGAPPHSALPLGMTYGRLQLLPGLPVTVSNLGCAACHAGVTYDAHGAPLPDRAWLGLPNTSLNLEAYTMGIYRAYTATIDDPDTLMKAVKALFPDTSPSEQWTLRHLVLPRVRTRLAELKSAGRPLPFPNGSPGATNGVAALKMAMNVPMSGGGRDEYGVTSIPDLGLRAWKSSLLYDGAYAPIGAARQTAMTAGGITPAHVTSLATIATFFSVPSMGVKPAVTERNIPKATDVFAFLATYHAPPFPGAIDMAAAARGQKLYAAGCASCHGSYDANLAQPKLTLFPNWIGDTSTDTARAAAFTPELARAVNATAYRDKMSAASTGGYVAPPLSGLWATAPYLHNGSVPSLAALLRLTSRPQHFLVGGHRLDFKTVGIDLANDGTYPTGYVPWSKPEVLDTTTPGHGNAGHTYGTHLTPAEKRDLIEYLKLL